MKVDISKLKSNPDNPRQISKEKFELLKKSIQEFPEMLKLRPLVIKNNVVLGGNMRLRAMIELGYKEVEVIQADNLTEAQKKEFVIKDNSSFGSYNWDLITDLGWNELPLEDWGLDIPDFDVEPLEKENKKKLSDRFIIPPFSVLDTKQGAWQQRKNYWLSLGIKSEEGRDAVCITNNDVILKDGTKFSQFKKDKPSIFDPVLCELAYQWFNVPNGNILDPFAGGSVRGIVASKLGFNYLGNDLSAKQIDANRINAKEVLQDSEIYPTWTCGDSLNIDKLAKDYKADMIFSCPPYADLEKYSDAKEDISNMSYEDFLEVYKEIIRKSCEQLKEDRFAVFVVGDVRDKKGFYQNFVSDTIMAFWNCGVILYNEMILLNFLGNAGMRAAKTFNGGRKVTKVHQNVLVFYKGNPKNIKANYPELDLSYINDLEEEDGLQI